MQSNLIASLSHWTDQQIVEELKRLAQCERDATAELIAHLAVMDGRQLYLPEGCSSMYAYCTRVLHFSEYAAYRRIQAARAARRFPIILEWLAGGEVNLTTVRFLAPVLTPENHRAVLDEARGKSKAQVKEIVARLNPKPDVRASIRKVPVRKPKSSEPPQGASVFGVGVDRPTSAAPVQSQADLGGTVQGEDGREEDSSSSPTGAAPRPAAAIEPLSPGRFKIVLTTDGETTKKLARLKELMRHSIPDGDLAKIFERAVNLLLHEVERRRLRRADRPRAAKPVQPGSRHIPAEVKRVVWERDGGQCAFVGHEGRCTERNFLQYHHADPHGDGGKATVQNIQMRCRDHNLYEAEQYFGSWRADRIA